MTKKKKNASDNGVNRVTLSEILGNWLSPYPLPPTLETMDTDERFRKVLIREGIPPDAPDKWKRLALHYALRHERDMRPAKRMGRRGRPRSRTLRQEIEFRSKLVRDVQAKQKKARSRLGVLEACKRLKKCEPYKFMPQKPSTFARIYGETLAAIRRSRTRDHWR